MLKIDIYDVKLHLDALQEAFGDTGGYQADEV